MPQPLWGVADTHAHFFANLAYGGLALWGSPYAEGATDRDRIEKALSTCHHGLISLGLPHNDAGGFPEFDVWPTFQEMTHQQAYIEWIKRAYEGGLRLVSCVCVNNEFIAKVIYEDGTIPVEVPPPLPYDNQSVIVAQIDALKAMVAWVGQHEGGWIQIATTPQEAREIVGKDKLAVVIGVEIDNIGGWRTLDDLHRDAEDTGISNQSEAIRTVIRGALKTLHDLGVRQINPIHLVNNPFGGTSIYNIMFVSPNKYLTGEDFEVEEGFEDGIRYAMDYHTRPESFILDLLGINNETLGPYSDFMGQLRALRSHRNKLGLTAEGVILIEEIIRLGIVIDLEHMGEKSRDRTLKIAIQHKYPLMFGHSKGFRDLGLTADVPYDSASKRSDYHTENVEALASEIHATRAEVETIRDLGGMVSPLLYQSQVRAFDGPDGIKETATATVDNNCAGTSRSWAQAYLYGVELMGGKGGIGLGTDINGLAQLPGPRFGTFGAHGLKDDDIANPGGKLRLAQVEAQRNGVAYDATSTTTGAYRFAGKAYDAAEGDDGLGRDIWRGIAIYQAGLSVSDSDVELDRAQIIALGLQSGRAHIDHYGIVPVVRFQNEFRAGYQVASGGAFDDHARGQVSRIAQQIESYMAQWAAMTGNNSPLPRAYAAPGLRDFDYNLDGFAHYGMMRDFLQDLKNIGLTDEHLDPLYHSAEAFIRMWELCQTKRDS